MASVLTPDCFLHLFAHSCSFNTQTPKKSKRRFASPLLITFLGIYFLSIQNLVRSAACFFWISGIFWLYWHERKGNWWTYYANQRLQIGANPSYLKIRFPHNVGPVDPRKTNHKLGRDHCHSTTLWGTFLTGMLIHQEVKLQSGYVVVSVSIRFFFRLQVGTNFDLPLWILFTKVV